jgi:N-acetylglucosamine-6-phosphate deacetylase
MIVLAGGGLVLPDRVLPSGSLIIDPADGTIAAIEPRPVELSGADVLDCRGCTIVPGFIDVHVHGVAGVDVLDGPGAVAEVAARLPWYGVTAFCPTSVACTPAALGAFLDEVASVRRAPPPGAARVLPAHFESNFINPDWRGAQPLACLRSFTGVSAPGAIAGSGPESFTGGDIVSVIEGRRLEVGIVTLAPEMDGGLDLVRLLAAAGHVVSIGHSGATYDQARAAIEAGVRHATHLFNRMSPLAHRAPGVAGAAIESPLVAAEIICDGWHVHPALVSIAVRAKGSDRVMAITDGTAGAGLPPGATAHLGGQTIRATATVAELEDGTMAGSVQTMDGVFRMLVMDAGIPLPMAAGMCAATPAAQMGLRRTGRLAAGAWADVAVLDAGLRVRQTFIAGRPALEPPFPGPRLSGVAPG